MLRDVTTDQVSSARLREVIASSSGDDAALWKLLVGDLGLLGVALAEESGGIGGSFVDASVVIEESGRGLWPVPMTSSLVAVAALGSVAATELLQAVAAGEWRAAVVVSDEITVSGATISGRADHVIGADDAELLVIACADGLYAVQAADIVTAAGLDPLRRLSTVILDRAAAPTARRCRRIEPCGGRAARGARRRVGGCGRMVSGYDGGVPEDPRAVRQGDRLVPGAGALSGRSRGRAGGRDLHGVLRRLGRRWRSR